MALTEVNGVDVDMGRAEMARGLCELAQFLLDHPDVPEPHVYISAVGSTKALVAWCDGMDVDDLQVEMGPIDSYRQLVRTFAALPVTMSVRAESLGEVREVQTTTTELVPMTPAEIVARYTTADAEAEARGAHQVEIEEAGF
jgi:hypothetical protein